MTDKDAAALRGIVGRKMLLQGRHPFAGNTGEVIGAEKTPVGWGIKLRISTGSAAQETFVFNHDDGIFVDAL